MQFAAIWTNKIDKRKQAANRLAYAGCECCSKNSPTKNTDQHGIKHHICNSGGKRCCQSKVRLFSCYKKALKYILEHIGSKKSDYDTSVQNTAVPPVPIIKPRLPRIMINGITKLMEANAVFPAKFDTKNPSTTLQIEVKIIMIMEGNVKRNSFP